LPLSLRVKGGMVKKRSSGGISAATGNHLELLLSSIEFARKAE
jgi:hypothetical protein